jgi:hypothetical protein
MVPDRYPDHIFKHSGTFMQLVYYILILRSPHRGYLCVQQRAWQVASSVPSDPVQFEN